MPVIQRFLSADMCWELKPVYHRAVYPDANAMTGNKCMLRQWFAFSGETWSL